jgi:hypothetical protein
MLRFRLLAAGETLVRRVLAGPVLVVLGAAGGGALATVGLAASERAVPGAPKPGPSIIAEWQEPDLPPSASAPAPSASSAPAPVAKPTSDRPPYDRAPEADLAAAIARGSAGLAELQRKYPRDPAVLKPLALELGKEPQRGSELLRVLDALFLESPEAIDDPKLGILTQSLALTPSTSQRAIELMRGRMGLRGAEMLFDILLSQPEIRPRARAALESPDVQRILTPALKIAFDLHVAISCESRVKLLPQAIRDGDERAIGQLTIYSLPSKKGCGFRKQRPCPPPCAKDVPQFEAAIKQIKQRLASSPKEP